MSFKRITVFLLRDVASAQDAIHPDRSPHAISLSSAIGLDGTFFYKDSFSKPPHWVGEIQPALSTGLTSVFSSSASGLLILKTSGRFFAITFGYGKGFIDPAKIQRQFGLRVALNRVDPAQMRSMDTKTFEDQVVTKNTQTSKSSDLPAFGVDVSRDILRAVAGEPRSKSFAKRLAGSDALVLSLDITVDELGAKCDELLVAYEDDAYKADFEWIDHLEIVDDRLRINALDEMLVSQLRSGDTSSTHMAMPEPTAWEDIDAFRITGTKQAEYDDLDLEEYLTNLGAGIVSITAELLRSRTVSIRYTREARSTAPGTSISAS